MNHAGPIARRSPWYARVLLTLFCPWHLREEVAGDLEELFRRRAARLGAGQARRMYLRDLRSLVRLAAGGEGNRGDQYDRLIALSRKGDGIMGALGQDIRYGLRGLAHSPAFTLVTVLTLALGIGANTAIFSVVDAVLLRPLPFPEPERLVQVWNTMPAGGLPLMALSEPEFLFYHQHQRAFDYFAVHTGGGGTLTAQGEPLRVSIAFVSADFFPALGVQPLLGRSFTPEEDTPGSDRVLLLGHGLWKRNFGGDPAIVGREVTLNGRGYHVTGVMPPGFSFPLGGVDMWTPLAIDPAKPDDRGSHYLETVARMKPGVTVEQAGQEMNRLALAMDDPYDYRKSGWGAFAVPLRNGYVGNARTALLVLLGAVGFVLLIACANVANLMLARAAAREKEMAIRAALGSGRWRIARQLLTESLLLSLLGAAVGALLARWTLPALVALAGSQIPAELEIGTDWRVLSFALLAAVFTALLFGLAPALHAARTGLNQVLAEGGRSSGSGSQARFRHALIVSEIAVALVLLTGGGLMLRSFSHLVRMDPGFQTENILSFRISLPSTRYPTTDARARFFSTALQRIGELPGVEKAGAISLLPLSELRSSSSVFVEELPPTHHHVQFGFFESDVRPATPGYLSAVGMRLVAGRWLEPSDDAQSPLVAVVDETFAQRAWPGKDPLGRRISVTQNEAGKQEWCAVVGVVAHVKHEGLTESGREQVYLPHPQSRFDNSAMFVALRTASDPARLLSAARAEVRRLDAELPIFDVRSMSERFSRSLGLERLTLYLIAGFALLALLLASVGMYGVVSYSVAQRTREIGVRMALGADPRGILGMVLRSGLWLTGAGVAIGLAASLGLTRVLQSLLHGVSATDPVTFVIVPLVLTAVAALACCLPARRAARIDPMIALRHE